MPPLVLPIPTFAFQTLLLLITVAVEAIVLQRNLGLNQKSSVEYSLSLNLISSGIGWLIFFYIQSVLSPGLKSQVLSYIFFNWLDIDSSQYFSLIFCLALIIFGFVFLIEWQGFNLLQFIFKLSPDQQIIESIRSIEITRPSLTGNNTNSWMHGQLHKASVILLANACSHLIVLMVLFLIHWKLIS